MKWPAHDDKALARSSAEFLKSATWYMRVCIYIHTHTLATHQSRIMDKGHVFAALTLKLGMRGKPRSEVSMRDKAK